MKAINRLAALIATAAGAGLVAQAAFAGPGCNHSGMKPSAYDNGYQPAIYQLTPGERAAARAYPAGMGYGHSARSDAQADIVGTASAAGSFNTLVSAVKAADLVNTLKGEGPFTVFAPTDAAFAKLPRAQLEALLADKAALTKVLTYHVIQGSRVEAAEVVKLSSVKTIEGQPVKIDVGESVMVNNAKVVKTDISTSNGVIHVIDTVMLPPDMM